MAADEERAVAARQTLARRDLTTEDRLWLQEQLALTGACAPPGPPPVAIKHPWTPVGRPRRCALCDEPMTAPRHWVEETDG